MRTARANSAHLDGGPRIGIDFRWRAARRAAAAARHPALVARGPGLRGGSFRARGERVLRLRLQGVRFVEDATVDGSGSWRAVNGAARGSLALRSPGAPAVRVRLAWTRRARLASARVGDATLALPAP